jgi:anionic cell wall polymer biosynthesis LytR-Cps2A-Psr (LCP) family protein
LAKIIDALGGVSVNLTDDEVYYLNGYIKETSNITGIESGYIEKGGMNIHLNGVQAVSYCRIRYTRYYVYDDNNNPVYSNQENKIQLSYGSDFGRTARQRNVMSKLVSKAKSAGVTKLMEIADIVFKSTDNNKLLKTSLTYDEILSMIPTLIEFSLVSEEGKQGFPYSYVTPTINGASMVVVRGHSRNVTLLHEYLFGEKDYIPSDIVQRINNVITSVSGY